MTQPNTGITQKPEPSKGMSPKEVIKAINTLIEGLELWKKKDEDLTHAEVDSAVLGIGKLKGAINKLNRE